MSKRFATIFFITIATIMILAVAFFMVLFLAPGVSIFGLKYIGKDLHAYSSGVIDLNKDYGGEPEGIIINAVESPINVHFTEGRNYSVEYYCNYNGLTTSKIKDPSMEIERKGNKIEITITEYNKVLYETSSSERYLNLYVPIVAVYNSENTNPEEYKSTLEINANNSAVTFSKEEEADERIPQYKDISVKTTGKVNYGTEIKAQTYRLNTSSSITINEGYSNFIYATNYVLKSTSGKVTVKEAVQGNLDIETKNGAIKLISCKNLYVKTKHGSVKSAGDDAVTIYGIVDLDTKSGNIELGDVKGIGENKIITTSGKVNINKIVSGRVETERGSVTIKSVSTFTIKTNVGNVTVEEALGSIDVETKRGKVTLGGENMKLNNPKVLSRIGRVYIKSADGEVNIETISSDVEFKNVSSEKITIKSGGKLTAEGVTGEVNIFAEKNSTIRFSDITAASILDFGAGCKEVKVYALSKTKDEIGYRIYGSSITIEEYRNNAYIIYDGMNGSGRDKYEIANTNGVYLKLTSKDNKAKVNLYFKAP